MAVYFKLVEAAGVEPASASTWLLVLHAYSVYSFSPVLPDRQGKYQTSSDLYLTNPHRTCFIASLYWSTLVI